MYSIERYEIEDDSAFNTTSTAASLLSFEELEEIQFKKLTEAYEYYRDNRPVDNASLFKCKTAVDDLHNVLLAQRKSRKRKATPTSLTTKVRKITPSQIVKEEDSP